MRNLRPILLALCAMALVACQPSLEGQIVFTADGTLPPQAQRSGVAGIPVELHLVKAYASSKGKDGKSITKGLVDTAHSDAQGFFRFKKVDPGEYEIKIGSKAWDDGYTLTTKEEIIRRKAIFKKSTATFGLYREGFEFVKSNCPETVAFPQSVLCEQVYKNTTPAPLANVKITAAVPDGLEAIPLYGGVYIHNERTIHWTIGAVAQDEEVTVGFTLIPALPASEAVAVAMQWSVSTATKPEAREISTLNTNITAFTKASVRVDGPAQLSPGVTTTYHVNYLNVGTLPLSDVVVSVIVPAEVNFSASVGGEFSTENRTIAWKADTLALHAKGKASFTISVPTDADPNIGVKFHASLTAANLSETITAKPFSAIVVKTE
jgi:hypothetical protein